ncbi:hypothetical protein XENTR_v10013723 [Xenopus tropicalis]|nr:hypothetical protein XENTR_v10013723 [Xenopus tropicalis]KAE8601573.1 hypothetical protein XENTR_v10013723 [Xenopus tropicalis]
MYVPPSLWPSSDWPSDAMFLLPTSSTWWENRHRSALSMNGYQSKHYKQLQLIPVLERAKVMYASDPACNGKSTYTRSLHKFSAHAFDLANKAFFFLPL